MICRPVPPSLFLHPRYAEMLILGSTMLPPERPSGCGEEEGGNLGASRQQLRII
jgi:hypothetical protein